MRLFLCIALVLGAATWIGGAHAWPTSSYRGHATQYYNVNGVNYAMVYVHQHSVSQNTCPSNHLHHYQGYKQLPNGSYVRIETHDHHLCAPSH